VVAAVTKDNGRNVLMESNIKQRIAAGALALTLLGGSGVGVAAQGNGNQTGGAAGLVAAVVQADDVVEIVDSFNNLRALNNVLNNSPILNDLEIDVTVEDVDVLTGADLTAVIAALNLQGLTIDDVVGISFLDADTILVFV
jgi:hypothetical protein